MNQHLDDRSARGRRTDPFLLQGFLERLIGHSLTRRLHQLQQGRLIEALRCRRLKLRQRRLMWIALALLKIRQLLNCIVFTLLCIVRLPRLILRIQRLPTGIDQHLATCPKRLLSSQRIDHRHRLNARRKEHRNQPNQYCAVELTFIARQAIAQHLGWDDCMVIGHLLIIDDPFGKIQCAEIQLINRIGFEPA